MLNDKNLINLKTNDVASKPLPPGKPPGIPLESLNNFQSLFNNIAKQSAEFGDADIFIYVMADDKRRLVKTVIPFKQNRLIEVNSQYFIKILSNNISDKNNDKSSDKHNDYNSDENNDIYPALANNENNSIFQSLNIHPMLNIPITQILVPDVSSENVCLAFSCLHKNTLNYTKFSDIVTIDLYKTFDFLQIEQYRQVARDYLIKKLNTDNFMDILSLSDEFNPHCQKYIQQIGDGLARKDQMIINLNEALTDLESNRREKVKENNDIVEFVQKNLAFLKCKNCLKFYGVTIMDHEGDVFCPYCKNQEKLFYGGGENKVKMTKEIADGKRAQFSVLWNKFFGSMYVAQEKPEESSFFDGLKFKLFKSKVPEYE